MLIFFASFMRILGKYAELQIRGDIEDNTKIIIILISQQKHML